MSKRRYIVKRFIENTKYLKGMLNSNKIKLEKYSLNTVFEDGHESINVPKNNGDVLTNLQNSSVKKLYNPK